MSNDIDNVRPLLDAGAATARLESYWVESENTPEVVSAVVPAGYRIETADIAAKIAPYQSAPRRVSGTAVVTDTASWLAYFGKHGTVSSEVFADVNLGTVTALLNAPRRVEIEPDGAALVTPTLPAWGDHRLVLQLHHSAAWSAWTSKDGKPLSQVAFAEHIEDRTPDFVDPDAATMLEIAQTFQQTKGVKFESSQRLANGQTRFQYHETVESKAGQRGDLDVPSAFSILLQPWRGVGVAVPLTARLRSRTDDGLRLTYVLDRMDDALDAAWRDLLGELTETLPVPVLAGTAPMYAGR